MNQETEDCRQRLPHKPVMAQTPVLVVKGKGAPHGGTYSLARVALSRLYQNCSWGRKRGKVLERALRAEGSGGTGGCP